ncbi:signal peptidase I, partial [Dysosmobacter welbionis]
GLDVSGVGKGGQGRVDGHLRQHGQMVALRSFGSFALAEEMDLLPAVRAGDIAHVLHQAHDGDLHHLCHLHGFLHHHAHQLLGRGHDHDAVQGNGLEHTEGHIAGSRRHIHEQVVAVPQHVSPELLDHAGDDRAPPDDRVRLVGQQQVGAHHLNAGFGHHGIQARLAACGLAVDAEGLGDGGTGDVGIQNADLMAPAAH